MERMAKWTFSIPKDLFAAMKERAAIDFQGNLSMTLRAAVIMYLEAKKTT